MATHRNPSIVENSQRIFNFKSTDNISEQIAPVITPIIPISPAITVLGTGNAVNTTAANIFTSATGKRTYITGIEMSTTCDAANTSTNTYINIRIKNVVYAIGVMRKVASVAETQVKSTFFGLPGILIDEGYTVQVVNSNGTAVIYTSATVYGYTEEY